MICIRTASPMIFVLEENCISVRSVWLKQQGNMVCAAAAAALPVWLLHCTSFPLKLHLRLSLINPFFFLFHRKQNSGRRWARY